MEIYQQIQSSDYEKCDIDIDKRIGGKSRKIDFGKSRKIDLQHDLFYFIGKFGERIREVYEDSLSEISSILKYLDDIVDIYYESKKEYPIVSVVEFWNFLKI